MRQRRIDQHRSGGSPRRPRRCLRRRSAFGLAAFRACIQRNLELAEYAEALIRGYPELTLMAPAMLGIVCFRREWPGCDEAETERRGTALAEELERGGTALVSTTRHWLPLSGAGQLGRSSQTVQRRARARMGS